MHKTRFFGSFNACASVGFRKSEIHQLRPTQTIRVIRDDSVSLNLHSGRKDNTYIARKSSVRDLAFSQCDEDWGGRK